MPFTLAHPAIVVPLWRRFPRALVLSALVVGSMAPDFEYFVFLRPIRTIGHDLIGIPLLCVPAGLLVLSVYENLLKGPVIALLPGPLRRRLRPFSAPEPIWRPARRFALVAGSLALGAFSHIAWDACTHEHGWVVQRVPALAATLLDRGLGEPLKMYKALQYGCTIVGLALLGGWCGAWVAGLPEREERQDEILPETARLAWIATLAVVPVLIGLGFGRLASGQGTYRRTVRTVVPTITAAFLLTSVYGATSLRRTRSRPGGLPGPSNSSYSEPAADR